MKGHPDIKRLSKMNWGKWYPLGGKHRVINLNWGRRLRLTMGDTVIEVSIPDFKEALKQKGRHRLLDFTHDHDIYLRKRSDKVVVLTVDQEDSYLDYQEILWFTRAM